MERPSLEFHKLKMFYRVIGLLLLGRGVVGFHNETVDDQSGMITYTGTWLESTRSSGRIDNTTHYTKIQGSYATFSFTGATTLYYVGYAQPTANIREGTVMDVEFDGTIHRVDQYRNEHAQVILWSSGPIDVSQTHTIICRKTSENYGGFDVNVDAFILTVPDAGDVITTPQATSATPSGSGAPSTSATASIPSLPSIVWGPGGATQSASTLGATSSTPPLNTAAIAGGTVGGVLLLTCVAVFFYLLGRRRQRASNTAVENAHHRGEPTGVKGADVVTSATSIDGIHSAQNDMGTANSTPLLASPPVRHEKRRRDWSAAVSPVTTSDENTRIRVHGSSYEDDGQSSSVIWASGPPAYDQLVGRGPYPVFH